MIILTAPSSGIGPVIPASLMPSGQGYVIQPDGTINALPEDVGILLGLGFKGDVSNNNSGSGLNSRTISITSSQLLALGDSPPVLIPTPGLNKFTLVSACCLIYTAGSHFYDADNASIRISYSGSSIISSGDLNIGDIGSSSIILTLPLPTATDPVNVTNKNIILFGNDLTAGPIVTSTIGAPGAAYAPGDTGTITTHSGDAIYVVDSVSAGGHVTAFHLSNPGTGFYVENGNTTSVTTGTGDGNFTVNVTSVQLGNGTIEAVLVYQTIDISP